MSLVVDTQTVSVPLAGHFVRPDLSALRGSLSRSFASNVSASLPAGLAAAGLVGAVALAALSTVALPMAAADSGPASASLAIAEQPARAAIVAAPPAPAVKRASRSVVRTVTTTRTVTHTVPIGPIESGVASWYGPGFAGRRTSSGEVFVPSAMTAAHKYLPFGSLARVCASTGRCVTVRITDRGPFVAGRIVDLSAGAHDALGMGGLAHVTLTPIGTHVVTEKITTRLTPSPARASRSQERTRLVAGEAHPVRVVATTTRHLPVVSAPAPSAPSPGSRHQNPATALAPLATLAAFGGFRGRSRLELDEALALPASP